MAERKTALVLSAGGMFGAYQAGAWRAMAEQFEPDIVVGASVGALNGWSIAAGCSPERLIEAWRDPAAGNALRLYPNAGWRNGWFDPATAGESRKPVFRIYAADSVRPGGGTDAVAEDKARTGRRSDGRAPSRYLLHPAVFAYRAD
jgi:hypothetical protein